MHTHHRMSIPVAVQLLTVSSVMLLLWWSGIALGIFANHVSTVWGHNLQATPPIALTSLEDRWGIHVVGVRLAAAGYMLDFRYRVTDAKKALPLFSRQTRPSLIDQASGARFIVPRFPKTGLLRPSNQPLEQRSYFMFFANPGKYIKPGNKVTVVIGDFRAENLTVE